MNWEIGASVFLGLIGGTILHELSHAVFAWLLGAEDVTIDPWNLVCKFKFSEGEPYWKDRAVGGAPLFISAGIMALIVLAFSVMGPLLIIALVSALAVNSLFVSEDDLNLILKPQDASG